MGKIALSVVAFLLCGSSSLVHAQKRVEAGLLLDYLNVSQTKTDNVVGSVAIESEIYSWRPKTIGAG
jgi:hypothetical protein